MSHPHSYGRHPAADPRDRQYRLRGPRAASRRQSRFWHTGSWSDDQGDVPRCVGSSCAHWLASRPVKQWLAPQGIYELAQHLDEWEGNDYEGTSVRAGFKVLQLLGAIDEYRWTWDADDLAAHLLEVGPAVIGVDWYAGMDEPDERGVMTPRGELLGGHAVLVCGFTRHGDRFKIKNSWSQAWGRRGCAWLARCDLDQLLKDGGEAAAGVERKLRNR